MLVTFRAYCPEDRSEQVREVHSVYASEGMRGQSNAQGHTIPVVIGQWMFDCGLLTRHSPDRTDAGDRWAAAVHGENPPRDQIGTDHNAQVSGQGALALLNDRIWDLPPGPTFARAGSRRPPTYCRLAADPTCGLASSPRLARCGRDVEFRQRTSPALVRKAPRYGGGLRPVEVVELLEYNDTPEASEYYQSRSSRPERA